jgi:hypothetical protein
MILPLDAVFEFPVTNSRFPEAPCEDPVENRREPDTDPVPDETFTRPDVAPRTPSEEPMLISPLLPLAEDPESSSMEPPLF